MSLLKSGIAKENTQSRLRLSRQQILGLVNSLRVLMSFGQDWNTVPPDARKHGRSYAKI